MNEILLVIIFLGFLMVAALGYYFLRQRSSNEDKSALLMLQNQLQDIRQTLDSKLSDSTKMFLNQSSESSKILRDLAEKLVRLEETNKQVVGFTDQLQNLQDILKNPKQRGILGEYYLETLLKNVMPPGSYQMQFGFPDGVVVDAVIFVRDKIIPVDSKFSLENYNRLVDERNEAERSRLEKVFVNDLKQRIVETSKYIQPSQGTVDFAFMFIPHEAIYYDLIINKVGALKDEDTENLIQRAARKYHVFIVSPTSFLAYLQTVLQGLKALQIEESAKEIRKGVERLQKHLLSYEEYMKRLGNNLGTTVNMYNKASGEFRKIDKDLLKITGRGGEVEVLELDKPKEDE